MPSVTYIPPGLASAGGAAAAGTLTGSTLASGVTASSLTSVGTIATGDWQGTDVGVAHGGTGVSTLTANGILVGNGTSDVAVTATMATKGHLMVGDGSGVPSMLAVGTDDYVLTADDSEGSGVKWAEAGGGGLTYATQYRLTADTTRGFLTSNLEVPDTYGYGTLGTAVGESSGVFSFPATGHWLINFTAMGGTGGPLYNYLKAYIYTSTDTGSNYYAATLTDSGRQYYYQLGSSVTTQFLFDVTNVSTHLVKLYAYTEDTGWNIMGDTGQNETHATFIKLGDT